MNSQTEEVKKSTYGIEKELKSIEETEKALEDKLERVEARLNDQELERKVEEITQAKAKTYLTLWYNTEGAAPTAIVVRLQEIGFKPTTGKYDFVYDWKRKIALKETFQLGDIVRKSLKGLKVLYKLETV